jgi:hypothetical protein
LKNRSVSRETLYLEPIGKIFPLAIIEQFEEGNLLQQMCFRAHVPLSKASPA